MFLWVWGPVPVLVRETGCAPHWGLEAQVGKRGGADAQASSSQGRACKQAVHAGLDIRSWGNPGWLGSSFPHSDASGFCLAEVVIVHEPVASASQWGLVMDCMWQQHGWGSTWEILRYQCEYHRGRKEGWCGKPRDPLSAVQRGYCTTSYQGFVMCHEIFVILLQFKVQICSIIISTTTLPLYKNCKLYVNFFLM